MTTILRLPIFALVLAASPAGCQTSKTTNPEAVGKVAWGRDYRAALAASGKSGKPVFALFQEVPGCAGCRQFGRDVLGDDKVVAAIEANFTPLLIHNNAGGEDAKVLAKYGEPAWNYQVVRFLNSDGTDLIPRKDRVWEAPELLARMKLALKKADRKIPADFGAKAAAVKTKQVAFSQYCFWTGEMKLGAMAGVKRTEAGYLGGREVTLVDYNPAEISLEKLTKQARAAGVADGVHEDFSGYQKAPASDQKRQIQGTRFAKCGLTGDQATKVNAFARTDPAQAEKYLTAAQRAAAQR